jgi:hypothetical protein
MSVRLRRYRAVLGSLFAEAGVPLPESLQQLVVLLHTDDGPGIVAWLE